MARHENGFHDVCPNWARKENPNVYAEEVVADFRIHGRGCRLDRSHVAACSRADGESLRAKSGKSLREKSQSMREGKSLREKSRKSVCEKSHKSVCGESLQEEISGGVDKRRELGQSQLVRRSFESADSDAAH